MDDGTNVRFDTYLAHLIGGPTAIGAAGEKRLSSIIEFGPNVPVELKKPEAEAITNAWRANHDTDFSEVSFVTMFDMLAKAIDKAGSTDALKVALALEDMKMTDLVDAPVQMRKEDHQLLMPFYAASFTRDEYTCGRRARSA